MSGEKPKLTRRQLDVLMQAAAGGELTLHLDRHFYRPGSDDPICDLPTMIKLLESELMDFAGARSVRITFEGRRVERRANPNFH
jgi:hypothetical protein